MAMPAWLKVDAATRAGRPKPDCGDVLAQA
jgi:hypothetical protein